MSVESAQQIINRLWADALDVFGAGQVHTDPFLLDRAADNRRADNRRGVTLVIRPDAATCARIAPVLDRLCTCAPDQYHYRLDELHITVLSLISASEGYNPAGVPLDAFRARFESLFPRLNPFSIHYRGVTASPDSVMLWGVSGDDALNDLRDRLRQELRAVGLGDGLDHRYRVVTTHTTVLRFVSQPRDLPGLVSELKALHEFDMGTFEVSSIDFVDNDWYMSHDRVKLLGRYHLGS
ncbi:MAG: 2'-5' RNA ligase family protein [Anaerolineae bacterium]|nr:2'-5' RNA ligase family protein [Anaerolineae bacterium]